MADRLIEVMTMKKWDFGKDDRDPLVQWNSALRSHRVVAFTGFHYTGQFYINTVEHCFFFWDLVNERLTGGDCLIEVR